MNTIEERLQRLEYYQSLLVEIIDSTQHSFTLLVIKSQLSKEEVKEIHQLCRALSEQHEEQKAQGLVIFTDLLTLFAGQLNSKVNVSQTIKALHNQNLYKPLMQAFLKYL
ncbi:DUF1878 family protein [Metabacillus herbersteinensis]|uniref:DUF1878 family protein n=1 Tax=Metabacillus herbersteinensis TaxID=283816 RepID=A0ABV6GEF4_9BACI